MPKEIRLVVDHNGNLKNLIWISLQEDDSISIGMSDRTFKTPGLMSELELDGVIHQSHADLEAKHGSEAITNPHFTFHPPMYVHLRANNQTELFAGLLGVDFIVESEGRLPWIRFVSNSIRELKPFEKKRVKPQTEIIRLLAPSDDYSVEVGFDFVQVDGTGVESGPKYNHFITWGGRILHIFARYLPGQKSTLWWQHQS